MSCLTFLTPQQRAALIAAAPRPSLEEILAAHPVPEVTPGKLHRLRALAADGDPKIRESAASNHHAPADLLDRLAGDPAEGVRCCVARNERTPQETLRRLATDGSAQVRAWVAANRSTPDDLLEELSGDTEETVRRVVTWSRGWS